MLNVVRLCCSSRRKVPLQDIEMSAAFRALLASNHVVYASWLAHTFGRFPFITEISLFPAYLELLLSITRFSLVRSSALPTPCI